MLGHTQVIPLRRRILASDVTISGRPSATWAVLTDPLWIAQWFPDVQSLEGDFRLHRALRATAVSGDRFSIHVDDMILERRLKLRVHRTSLIVSIEPQGLASRQVTFIRRSWGAGAEEVPAPSVLAAKFSSLFDSSDRN